MKLIHCLRCNDIVALTHKKRFCFCKQSWGNYKPGDDVNAVVGGCAVPLGVAMGSLNMAVANRPAEGNGLSFKAFVIPQNCPTVEDPAKLTTADFICKRLMGLVK